MTLQNYQYDAIMREYSLRQSRNRRLLEEHRGEACGRIPRLAAIDEEVASISAQMARTLLNGGSGSLSELKASISRLSRERRELLEKNGYPVDYLEPSYTCPICRDTGYTDGKKCSCFKKMEMELLYAQSNLQEILEEENFDHFSFDFYSDEIKNEATGLTALQTAMRAYDTAWDFIRNFDTRSENLFLYGNTGVGKTFLSHCIARELLNSAHWVLYFSAFDLFDVLARSAFSRKQEETSGENPVFDCDLLIVDDLGTELTNSFVASQLFLCVNERLLRHRSTIISTNLSLEDFSQIYSERTLSRISSNYHLVKLIGKDIRIQKIFLGGK